MLSANPSCSKLSIVTLALGMIAVFGLPLRAQDDWQAMDPVVQKNIADWTSQGKGLPEDWSHHHLIFSNPGTEGDAFWNGTHDRWPGIVNNSRYIMQQIKRNRDAAWDEDEHFSRRRSPKTEGLWGESLGTGATVGAGNYPAKYSYRNNAPSASNCAGGSSPDYVAFNTSVAGSSTQASIVAYDNLYSGTCAGTLPQTYWAYDTGGTISTSVVTSHDGNELAFIHTPTSGAASLVLLKWSVTGGAFTGTTTNNSKSVGMSTGTCNLVLPGEPIYGPGIPTGDTISSCASNTITLANAANATNSTAVPLTYNNQFTDTLSNGSPDVTVTSGTCTPATAGSPIYGTGIPQGATISSCSGTSLVLSANATVSGNETLSFNPATASAPVVLTSTTQGLFQSCVAPCMYSMAFGDGNNDTKSSPFYDYDDDVLYVGDNNGSLHKFTPVFNSANPTEFTSAGWPVTVSSGNVVLSPVYDFGSRLVFVAANSTSGVNSGYLYSVTTTGSPSQTVLQSGEIARHYGISDAPIVDSTSEKVYVFTANDSDSQSTSYCGTEDGNDACAAVWQLATNFTAGTRGNESTMGIAARAGLAPTMFAGTFDNTFYSGNGTSGNLYVCGYAISGTVPNQNVASINIYQIPVSTWPNDATNIEAITNASVTCSPVAEIYNQRTFSGTVNNSHTVTGPTGTFTAADIGATISGTGITSPSYITGITGSAQATVSGTTTTESSEPIIVGDDWIYASVTASGTATGCTGACIYGYNVGNSTLSGSPVMARQVAGGTSGIVIDNTASGGGSQLYFTYLGPATSTVTCPSPSNATSGGCAVQASQAALQ
jgi:hypothetical protein